MERYAKRSTHISQKLALLQAHCTNVGRSYQAIERTVLGSIQLGSTAMSVDEVVAVCHELPDLGIQQVIYNMPNIHEITPIEMIAEEIIPRVSAF